MKRFLSFILASIFILLSGVSARAAGPSVEIKDITTPIMVDGNLSDFTGAPALVLDKKDQVVGGIGLWKSPETLSAKVWITYDKKYLYIGADIVSQNPQFNSQQGGEIYNGDLLEVYVGTDLSDPARSSYGLTDVQLGISPGKKGDKPVVYSFTDKADVPGAKVATALTKTGYTLEAAIPLEFLYKIDVGPNKSIAFDFGLDDTGAGNTARSLQMSWSHSDKAWQDPSVWGKLTFTGASTFVNTAPKVNATAIQIREMNPEGGKKKAGTSGIPLWGFNGNTGGFEGKTSQETKIVSEGTGALGVDIEGSTGWNQSLALTSEIPKVDQWDNFKQITFEVYMPAGSMKDVSYAEVFFVTQSPAANFFQAIKFKLQEGWNFVKADVDPTQFKGGVYKTLFIFNSGGPLHGTAIIDNVRGIARGANGNLLGNVTDESGKPVPDALVVIAKQALSTGADGSFRGVFAEDEYKVEILKDGYEVKKDMVQVASGKDTSWTAKLTSFKTTSTPAVLKVDFTKKLRTFNPHYMYGNNIAGWHEKEWFTEAAMAKIRPVFDFIRVPGGGYSNIWRWRTGDVLRKDGVSVDWAPPLKWENMANIIKALGPDAEVLMTLNIMTGDVQSGLDWIADAKARGLKVKYVEMGNEPDYEPELVYQGERNYWTVIDNYCRHYLEFAKAVRAKYPDIKLMGPTVAQLGNRERKEGAPWLAPETAPWWDGEFLKRCAPYVDVISLHTYPYWSNDSEYNLMTKTSVLGVYLAKVKKAIAEYAPGRNIEIAVTEWNSGDENAMTAKLANGIFCADFMGQMLVNGVSLSNIWDLYTQKVGLGGGHGVLDPVSDPTRPFAERAHYWAMFMFRKYFGDTLYPASTDQEMLSAYASTQGNTRYIMVINKSRETVYPSQVDPGAGTFQLEIYSLGPNQYQWSENLFRAVVNKGPVHQKAGKPVTGPFPYSFKPYTITCFKFTPAGVASAVKPAAK